MSDLAQRLTAALAGRYRIERPLGRGGMATVFLAEDLRHHRQVAIKVLDPEVAAAIGPERFLREIATVAQLTHPHILPLHDSGVADGLLFYVMPYVEGESLRARLTREKQLPIDDALRIAREVADALSCAHSRGIVHRDVKPENILLEEGHAVVADFGVARAVAAAGGDKLTATGIAVGTPAYMSPEQAAGGRDLDGRSDLYSLGCVLYEMLAGVPPFSGTTAESLAHQHLNVSPRPVTELRPAVPASVAAALQRALAKTPADRFNPVALFGEALAANGRVTASEAPRAWPRARRAFAVPGIVVVVGAAVLVTMWVMGGRRERTPLREPAPTPARTEVAVLPLQNLSAGGPHGYFAGGLHEELLTQLAKVVALKVISRTSVMGYEGTRKPLKQIAAELGVGSIVEGSVQVAGNRLRVNVQLIDAATDEHLWAERYDRALDDAFAIQSDVARRIVEAVGARLVDDERIALTEAPTANPEAYQLYLQGREYSRRSHLLRASLEMAGGMYERALALDSTFALAHAVLSLNHGQMLWMGFDRSPRRVARMWAEAQHSLRLAPGLPQAHVAMAMAYYRDRRDFLRALTELRIALRGAPNDADVWTYVGYAQRRLGDWRAADSAYQNAVRLDPRNVLTLEDLGATTFAVSRRYADAVRAVDRALALAPDFRLASVEKGYWYLLWKGDRDTLRSALAAMPDDAEVGGPYGTAGVWRARLLLWERKPDSLLVLLRRVEGGRLYEPPPFFETALFEAWAHRLRGDEPAARGAFAEALRRLETAPGVAQSRIETHAARGLALAGLGRRQEALREARWLRELSARPADHMMSDWAAVERACILAQVGELEPALDDIERVLAGPAWFSVHTFRLDPRWDPIREDPRFKALLLKYANPEQWAVR